MTSSHSHSTPCAPNRKAGKISKCLLAKATFVLEMHLILLEASTTN
jgi:hypothetical protein